MRLFVLNEQRAHVAHCTHVSFHRARISRGEKILFREAVSQHVVDRRHQGAPATTGDDDRRPVSSDSRRRWPTRTPSLRDVIRPPSDDFLPRHRHSDTAMFRLFARGVRTWSECRRQYAFSPGLKFVSSKEIFHIGFNVSSLAPNVFPSRFTLETNKLEIGSGLVIDRIFSKYFQVDCKREAAYQGTAFAWWNIPIWPSSRSSIFSRNRVIFVRKPVPELPFRHRGSHHFSFCSSQK